MSTFELECGVDEAGRGPLAGPVCAAAVVLPAGHSIAGLADSKKLTPTARERLRRLIEAEATAWSIALATVEEIDRLNILGATLLAMARAVEGLPVVPSRAWVDGTHCPNLSMPVRAVVGGDATVASISAASILAKTERDRIMTLLDGQYPGYGFARHKGYPTPAHVAALASLGPCAAHRRSFAPVRAALPCAREPDNDRRQA